MKTLFFVLIFTSSIFAQKESDITGDWILATNKTLITPAQIFKLEHFLEEYYVGALEVTESDLYLYKVRVFNIKQKQFLDISPLNDQQEKQHYFLKVEKIFKDSANISLIGHFPIDLGFKDEINTKGQVLMLDTTKIHFDLIYSKSDLEYQKEENRWRTSSNFRQVIFLRQNPLLFEYLMQKYSSKIKGIPLTYYRWSLFTWNKVNHLKSKDIVSISYLDRHQVSKIFKTASIDHLMQFKRGDVSIEKLNKIRIQLVDYHLVRQHSLGFSKAPNYWIFHFKDGSRIKIKTNLWERGFLDITNNKLYYNKQKERW